MAKRILVTGANGYLGSCTSVILQKRGYDVVGVDNYSTSKKDRALPFPIVELDLKDLGASKQFFAEHSAFDGVIHFAAHALVSESVEMPYVYFSNNVLSTVNILECARKHSVKHLIFSSSCTLYGIPQTIPITESSPISPVSPYGESKWLSEMALKSYSQLSGSPKILSLRYFNPAGALMGGKWGEDHEPETHLIPCILKAALAGEPVKIYGNDYPTQDGTAVRDFIHIEDLVEAHVRGLEFLSKQSNPHYFDAFNVGTGKGISVLEAVKSAEKVLKKEIKKTNAPRRAGDPPELIADPTKLKAAFGWSPSLSIDKIFEDHLSWLNQ